MEALVLELKTDLSNLGIEFAAIKSMNNKKDDNLEVTPGMSSRAEETPETNSANTVMPATQHSPENNTEITPEGSPSNGEVEQRVTDLQTKLFALAAKVEQSREMADQQQKVQSDTDHMISKVNTIHSDLQQNLKSRVKD